MWNRLSLGGRYLVILSAALFIFLFSLFILRFFLPGGNTAPQAVSESATQSIAVEEEQYNFSHAIRSGETLGNTLMDLGLVGNDYNTVTTLLGHATDLRRIPIGTEVNALTTDSGLVHLEIHRPKSTVSYHIRRSNSENEQGQFQIQVDTLAADTVLVYAEGAIENTFWDAFMGSGGTPAMAVKYIEIFQFVLYFSSETRVGDGYRFLVEEISINDEVIGYGHVPVAQYWKADGDTMTAVWRSDPKAEFGGDYFDTEGISFRRDLLRAPFPASRVTSTYGMRTHPITGDRKMHRGVDFGAPRGTPVVASGSGTITRLERNDPGYGNWVEITHGNSGYVTRYGHFSSHARGLRRGQWVKQGQVIGYVGATGMATGPHLHYEVRKDGRHLNPLSVKGSPIVKLTQSQISEFTSGPYRLWRKRLENPASMKGVKIIGNTIQSAMQSRLPDFMYQRVQDALAQRDSITAENVLSSEGDTGENELP